ncbi:MAG: hypothetical protein MZV65_38330 [Chromatiales bacterium]|nr:hypothetical protein [Chromatiales bacterium]
MQEGVDQQRQLDQEDRDRPFYPPDQYQSSHDGHQDGNGINRKGLHKETDETIGKWLREYLPEPLMEPAQQVQDKDVAGQHRQDNPGWKIHPLIQNASFGVGSLLMWPGRPCTSDDEELQPDGDDQQRLQQEYPAMATSSGDRPTPKSVPQPG